MWIDGKDLRGLPLLERKKRLARIVRSPALLVQHIENRGIDLFQEICACDMEGTGVVSSSLTRSGPWPSLPRRSATAYCSVRPGRRASTVRCDRPPSQGRGQLAVRSPGTDDWPGMPGAPRGCGGFGPFASRSQLVQYLGLWLTVAGWIPSAATLRREYRRWTYGEYSGQVRSTSVTSGANPGAERGIGRDISPLVSQVLPAGTGRTGGSGLTPGFWSSPHRHFPGH